MTVYNLLGQKMRQLLNNQKSAGVNSVIWDGRDENGHFVTSGTYFYKLDVNGFEQVRKMALMK